MKKHLLLLYIIICFLTTSFAQTNIKWQRSIGGSTNDDPYSIITTPDNGVIVSGMSLSTDGDVTGNHGGTDFWLVKLDSNGLTQWQKSYGGTGSDYCMRIINTTDHGFIFCGSTSSTDFDITNNHGGLDAWVVKSDSSGNIEWQKTYGGTSDDQARGIRQTNDNGYIICGGTASNNGDVIGAHGLYDLWLIKIDSIGNISWQKCYGGTSNESAETITQTLDGGYIVGGEAHANSGDVSGTHGGQDIWIIKIDSIGNLIWQKAFGGSSEEYETNVIPDSSGNYYVTGLTQSSNGNVTFNHGLRDGWILKLDPAGNIIWQKCFGGSSYDEFYDIRIKNSNEIFVCGYTESNDFDVTGNHSAPNYFDGWLIDIDTSGNLISQKCFGGSANEIFMSLQFSQTNSALYVTGRNASTDGDVIGNHGYDDYWVLKLTNDSISGTGINSILSNKGTSISPNPFSSFTTITLPSTINQQQTTIKIMDVLGKEIRTLHVSGKEVVLEKGEMLPGIYFVEIRDEKNNVMNKKIVVQ